MKVLAIETSTITGSIALLNGDHLIGEITLSVSVQHSERLMPAIDRLLQDAGVKLNEIDLFAVANGPGSFTGLRIGIAAAQGFSLATGKPVIGVSTLEALALNGINFPGLIVPVLDAFRGEIYAGFYLGRSLALEVMKEDQVLSVPRLIEELFLLMSPADSERVLIGQALPDRSNGANDPQSEIQVGVSGGERYFPLTSNEELKEWEHPILLLGNGLEICHSALVQAFGSERVRVAPPPLRNPRAANVGFLARGRWKENPSIIPEAVMPRYLRRPG